MSEIAPLLQLTSPDGQQVYVHMARIVKMTPADPGDGADSEPRPEHGSIVTIATGTGTTSLAVTEYLLHAGFSDREGFLFLTDLQGHPIKINASYVILVRPHQPSGTILEVHSATGTEDIYVRDSFSDVSDWWAESANSHMRP